MYRFGVTCVIAWLQLSHAVSYPFSDFVEPFRTLAIRQTATQSKALPSSGALFLVADSAAGVVWRTARHLGLTDLLLALAGVSSLLQPDHFIHAQRAVEDL